MSLNDLIEGEHLVDNRFKDIPLESAQNEFRQTDGIRTSRPARVAADCRKYGRHFQYRQGSSLCAERLVDEQRTLGAIAEISL